MMTTMAGFFPTRRVVIRVCAGLWSSSVASRWSFAAEVTLPRSHGRNCSPSVLLTSSALWVFLPATIQTTASIHNATIALLPVSRLHLRQRRKVCPAACPTAQSHGATTKGSLPCLGQSMTLSRRSRNVKCKGMDVNLMPSALLGPTVGSAQCQQFTCHIAPWARGTMDSRTSSTGSACLSHLSCIILLHPTWRDDTTLLCTAAVAKTTLGGCGFESQK